MLKEMDTFLTGFKKYIDVIPRFDELELKEQKRFLEDLNRDYGMLKEFLELNLKCEGNCNA